MGKLYSKTLAATLVTPSGPLQVVFSFDTTGSMSQALDEVRDRISEMVKRLKKDFPDVTIAVVAHGDYCDEKDTYITKHIDFTDDLPKLVDFVHNVEKTGGGDTPEAYEVMLRLVRKDLSWSPGSKRILVVIGDAYPHPPDDEQNKDKIDWEEEARLLKGEQGIRIYGLQVKNNPQSTEFFRKLTEITEGQHLNLSEFETLCDILLAICYFQKGPEHLLIFEAEVRARTGHKPLHKDLEGVFKTLKGQTVSASTGAPNRMSSALLHQKTAPVSPALCQAIFFCVFVLVCVVIHFLSKLFSGTDIVGISLIIMALTCIFILSR